MMVVQEHEGIFYAHLFLFVIYDEHIDEALKEAVKQSHGNEDAIGSGY